jgi:pyruvate dehydrogenase complex dehydrogenase (E1) component
MSDLDPLETREWLDALNSGVFERRSGDVPARRAAQWRPPQRRAGMVLSQYPLSEHVPPVHETPHHGDQEIEYKIRSLIRWKSEPVGGIHRS